MEQDQQFLEYVVKALADHPEDVKITRVVDEMGVPQGYLTDGMSSIRLAGGALPDSHLNRSILVRGWKGIGDSIIPETVRLDG